MALRRRAGLSIGQNTDAGRTALGLLEEWAPWEGGSPHAFPSREELCKALDGPGDAGWDSWPSFVARRP